MGWQLAEEVAWARPERAGPEWWMLLDIAQTARDETRQAWPGLGYLMARSKRSKRTVYRRLRLLADAKLLTVASKPGPGKRSVYEITAEVGELAAAAQQALLTGDTNADTRTGDTNADTRTGDTNGHRVPPGAPTGAKSAPTGDSVRDTPPVNTLVNTPVNPNRSVSDATGGSTPDPEIERSRQLAALEAMYGYGTCPDCKQRRRLEANGAIAEHNSDGRWCPGSTCYPEAAS